jgi:hypothetical protein
MSNSHLVHSDLLGNAINYSCSQTSLFRRKHSFCLHALEHMLSYQYLSNTYSYSADIIRAAVMGSYLLPDITAILWERFYWGLPEDVSL